MTVTTTSLGTVRGLEDDGCEIYLGIPYAQPPVGDLRFRRPERAKPWSGELDATRFGASAWQPSPMSGGVLPRHDRRMSEDCLFLNVYTPAADGVGRPVLLWIHGGSYTTGSGDHYNGRSFARLGDMVVVTINYRLGPFGFLDLAPLDPSYAGSHNNGIRDQIEALRWVRDNIAEFGGDPEQVTICGESAGAGAVTALLAAPEADGLFHRAISQSAPEGTLFSFGLPEQVNDEELREAVAEHTADPDRVISVFREEYPEHDNRRLMVEMLTDTMFRTPSLRVADAQADGGAPVHVYRFSWESRGFGGAFGATHALDIPFVWNADMNVWKALVGDGAPHPPALASQMHHAWISFVRTGDPAHDGVGGWHRYDTARRPTMDFGDTAEVVDDPRGHTRACWH